MASSSHSFHDK
jgi:hypothetical protein